jgi:uncharacterized protein YlxW (UPF0749 family)
MSLHLVAGVGSSLLDFGGTLGVAILGLSWLSLVQESAQRLAEAKANQAKLTQVQAELAQERQKMMQLEAEKQQLQAQLSEQTAIHTQSLAALQAELTTALEQLQKQQRPPILLRTVRLGWQGMVGAYRWYTRTASERVQPDVAVAK